MNILFLSLTIISKNFPTLTLTYSKRSAAHFTSNLFMEEKVDLKFFLHMTKVSSLPKIFWVSQAKFSL